MEQCLIRVADCFGEQETAAAIDVMAGSFVALDPEGDRSFRRFLLRSMALPPGGTFEVSWAFPRSREFHRAHFRLLSSVFRHQDTFDHLNILRSWLKLGSGFVDFIPNPETGALTPVPKSVRYAALEDEAFRAHHMRVVEFLRTPRATGVLWPHLNHAMQSEMIERLLEGD